MATDKPVRLKITKDTVDWPDPYAAAASQPQEANLETFMRDKKRVERFVRLVSNGVGLDEIHQRLTGMPAPWQIPVWRKEDHFRKVYDQALSDSAHSLEHQLGSMRLKIQRLTRDVRDAEPEDKAATKAQAHFELSMMREEMKIIRDLMVWRDPKRYGPKATIISDPPSPLRNPYADNR